MSGKQQIYKKNKGNTANASLPKATAGRKDKTPAAGSGINNMMNWLVLLVIILPVLFSRAIPDSAMTPRYIFLGLFILLFVLFFFLYKKTTTGILKPILIKIVFILGVIYAVWNLFTMQGAINKTVSMYEISRFLLNLLLLFIVMKAMQAEAPGIYKVCKAIMLVSIIQSLIGILQFTDAGFRDLPGNILPYGLMANRNLFGSAQVLVLPFSMYVFYKGTRTWKYTSLVALIFIIISIVISQTRSAWLATVGILLVSLILVGIFSKPNRKKWLLGTLTGFAGIAAIVALILITDNEAVISQSVKERAISLTQPVNLKDTTASAENAGERLKIWNKTLAMIEDHPVTGVGPGNWNLVVPTYGTEGLAWAYGVYTPDRPHNVYLLIASETGIPGAILYFGIWIVIAIIGFKTIIQTTSEDQRLLVILMMSGLTAFAIDCMFSFPNERIEHSMYFILMGGIILGSYINLNPLTKEIRSTRDKQFAVLFLIVAAFNLFLGIKKNNFEKHLNLAHGYSNEGQTQAVLAEVEKGKNIFATVDPIGETLELFSCLAYKDLKDFPRAIKEANISKSYNPNNAMLYNNIGTVYTDMKMYDSAIINYNKALQLLPHFEIPMKNLAANYFALGNDSACVATLSKLDVSNDNYLKDMLRQAKEGMEKKK